MSASLQDPCDAHADDPRSASPHDPRSASPHAQRDARPRRTHPRCAQRRGVMLFAVIVILAVAALAVGALNVAQEAEYAGLVASGDRAQQRATAWSGAQAVAAVLAAQRERMALGEDPDLPAEIVLWEADGRSAVVRVLPLGPAGERAVSETAKRSLAAVTADQLTLTGVVSETLARAVVARRGAGEAMEGIVDPSAGLSPESVLGPVVASIAAAVRAAQEGGRARSDADGARPLALADVLTPFEAQRALGEAASGGFTPRVILVGDWSAEARAAVEQQIGPGSLQRVRDALEGRAPADEGELVRALIKAGVEPAKWSGVLDAIVCDANGLEVDRVDLGRAPEAVLRTLPGIGVDKAARLAQEREALPAAERTQCAWPVVRGVLDVEEFAGIAAHIAVRSWLWRFRIVAGMVDRADGDDALQGVQAWDVVVDLSETPPRFASLRDSTLLPVAVGLAAELARGEGDATDAESERDGRAERGFPIGEDNDGLSPRLDRGDATAPSARGRSAEPADNDTPEVPPETTADRARLPLGERMRAEREARQRAEVARREANRTDSALAREGWGVSRPAAAQRPDARDGTGSGPSEEALGASPAGQTGRSASDAPAAGTPTGGLSGRWRTRGTH